MQSTVYVSNLAYTTTETDLENYFSPHGSIKSVKLLTDRETGRPRGIAFIEYTDETGASTAITSTDRKEFMGRTLNVSLARPKTPRTDSRPPYESREPRQSYDSPRPSYESREPRPSYESREPRQSYESSERTYDSPVDWGDSWGDKSSRRDRRENRRKFDR